MNITISWVKMDNTIPYEGKTKTKFKAKSQNSFRAEYFKLKSFLNINQL